MNIVTCPVGKVHLVLHNNVWQQMRAQRERFARWPATPAELQADLNAFERGVPTLAQIGKGKHEGQKQLMLCTPAYYFLAVSAKSNNAYFVPWMEPLGFREHERLVLGALMVKSTGWQVHTGHDTVPKQGNNGFTQIWREWQALEAQIRTESQSTHALTSSHESYLNTVSTLIEVTRELMRDKAALSPVVAYRQVLSTGEVRLTSRDMYVFRLAPGHPRVNQGNFLRLRDAPDLRGRVHKLEGDRMTIKFESAVDRRLIPEQGAFEFSISDKPFRLQQAAVDALRSDEAQNPYLLNVLVDGVYQSYHPTSLRPNLKLNTAQLKAFQRSFTVPDMLLVLGPPGTGKTRTIAEIVRQHGLGRDRVLVTAKTHKAVDNVLEKLSSELTVVRIGHEDRVSESTRHLLIDIQAQALQATLLQRTEPHAQVLTDLVSHSEEAEHKLDRFEARIDALRGDEQRVRTAQQKIEDTEAHIYVKYGQPVENLRNTLEKRAGHLKQNRQLTQTVTQQRVTAESRRDNLLLGLFWRWRSARLTRRLETLHTDREALQTDYDADARAYVEAEKALRRASQDPGYIHLKHKYDEIKETYRQNTQATLEEAQQLDRVIAGLHRERPPLTPPDTATFQRYLQWWRSTLPLLKQRQELLNDWRTELASRTEALYPILIRFADVVGATCIGIATDANFEDVDFSLVIADEAGQISLPDLLVPLVRAKRAMLVGDHHQLPPFVENEVQAWLTQVNPESLPDLSWVDEEATEAEIITNLLTKSVFELLFPTAARDHIVRFNEQYRMPQALADFAARCFYDRQLATVSNEKVYKAPHQDRLFKKPLALVDTSTLPYERRRETASGHDKSNPEAWGMSGYSNRLESSLIADIVEIYHRGGEDWVVIVPYRAQALQIRRELNNRLPAAPDLNLQERISTVDSFQGGECQYVIYGFTRSNATHNIGFLRELRRLNVAMTRAQRQLVLIGDMATLTQARDAPFREVMHMLSDHVLQVGDYLPYEECQARLASARGAR